MGGTNSADRYLSSESTRPPCPDNPARRVPTFFCRRSRGDRRAGSVRGPAHRRPADIPRAPDRAVRSRPLVGHRQRIAERDLRQRLPDAGRRHPRRPEHQCRKPPGTAAYFCRRTATGAGQPAVANQDDSGFGSAHRGVVGNSGPADNDVAAAPPAASADRKPDRRPAQRRAQRPEPAAAHATQTTAAAASNTRPAKASGYGSTQGAATDATTAARDTA
jgi:hypothetical protein